MGSLFLCRLSFYSHSGNPNSDESHNVKIDFGYVLRFEYVIMGV